jgi:(S)-ureidoglycine aminohydrolase
MKKIMLQFFTIFLIPVIMAQSNSIVSKVYKWNEPGKSDSLNKIEIFNGVTFSLKDLDVYVETIKSGKSQVIRNDYETLIIFKEGKLISKIKGNQKILSPGSIAYILSGDKIKLENSSNDPVTIYVLKYKTNAAADFQRGVNNGGSFLKDWNDLTFKPHDKGGVRKYFEHPTSMFNRFEMHVTTLNPGLKSHEPHTHKAAEIVLMIAGDADMQIGDTHQKARKGDVIFLESNIPHALNNIGKNACMYFAFQWD